MIHFTSVQFNNNNNNNNSNEEITLHVARTVNTEQLQHYYPRSMVCFRYVIVNTLHKHDSKNAAAAVDDDDNNNNNNNNGLLRK